MEYMRERMLAEILELQLLEVPGMQRAEDNPAATEDTLPLFTETIRIVSLRNRLANLMAIKSLDSKQRAEGAQGMTASEAAAVDAKIRQTEGELTKACRS